MPPADAPSSDELWPLRARLGGASPARDDAERIERLGLFEKLKAALSAAQAREAVAFDVSPRAEQSVAGVPPAQQGPGIASQIGLALGTTCNNAKQAPRWRVSRAPAPPVSPVERHLYELLDSAS